MRNRAKARVRHEAHHAERTCVYDDAVRLSENGIARGNVERSGDGVTAQNEKPSLSFRLQTPSGARRQIDPLEHEVGAGNEKCALVRKPVRSRPKAGWSGDCHRDCFFDVKLALAPVIEQRRRCVAALLIWPLRVPRDRIIVRQARKCVVSRRYPHDKSRIEPSSTAIVLLLLQSALQAREPWPRIIIRPYRLQSCRLQVPGDGACQRLGGPGSKGRLVPSNMTDRGLGVGLSAARPDFAIKLPLLTAFRS